jgi:DNA-directed RNA polymerase subunit E'/Rpb7
MLHVEKVICKGAGLRRKAFGAALTSRRLSRSNIVLSLQSTSLGQHSWFCSVWGAVGFMTSGLKPDGDDS